jgi:3-oxoacyl-[acyl-carrier-protein] synthase-1
MPDAQRLNMPTPTVTRIEHVGLVTPVGFTAPETVAALRAKVANPGRTRFMGSDGAWIVAHQVPMAQPWQGVTKLAKMAALAIEEALQHLPKSEWASLSVLLCAAEATRVGRIATLDAELGERIDAELGVSLVARANVVPHGRVGMAVALHHARRLMAEQGAQRVLIVAADSLLTAGTLQGLDKQGRLLGARVSDGFIPGEGAAAILVGTGAAAAASPAKGSVVCTGMGFGVEEASFEKELPHRSDGMAQAIRTALDEAGMTMAQVSVRIGTMSGEAFWFKEADNAVNRLLRGRHAFMDLLHPADCIGETGALSGAACLAYGARLARPEKYPMLLMLSNDDGRTAALVLRQEA